MKLSLFSASALVVAVATGCSSSSSNDAPGPLAFNADPSSDAPAEVYLEGRTEGDRVIVDVVAKGVKDVHGTAIRVKWDPEALALVEAVPSNTWSKQAVLLSKEAMPGTLAIAWAEKGDGSGHDATEPLVLGTITFDAKGRKGTPVSFRAERSAIVDHEGKTQSVSWRAGSVPAR
jgi:hypothetical protein